MRRTVTITILFIVIVLTLVSLAVLLYLMLWRHPSFPTSTPPVPTTHKYSCNASTYSCAQDDSGGTYADKTLCDTACTPVPTPTPTTHKYSCNASTYSCAEDDSGGTYTDKTLCDTACTPVPAPTTHKYSCNASTYSCAQDDSGGTYADKTLCDTACTPVPGPPPEDYYNGDGNASTTYFTSGESKGAGACGGCVYPGIKNMPPDYDFKTSNFDNLYDQMKNIVTNGAHWTMAAASEAMMAPYCPGNIGMGCTGRINPQGTTASAPCGSCWRLTRKGNNKVLNVVVADACPCGNTSVCPTTAGGADNSKWCLAEPGLPNSVGMYNHFDVWNAIDPVLDWPSTGQEGDPVTFENIACPSTISNLMAESCCGTYYDGSQGGSPQGCPNICGSQYTCPS